MSGDSTTLTTEQQDHTDFAAGFDEDTTALPTETPALQEGNTEKPTEPEAPKQPEAPAVEYAQITKAQLDELLGIKATAEKSFGTAFGKIGGIERTIKQLTEGSQVDIKQEDIDALRDDFPPLAAALEKLRGLRAIPGGGIAPEQIDELVQQRVAPALEGIDARVNQAVEMRLLRKQHPDFQQIDQDPAFAAWVAAQPDEFKQSLAKASAEYDSEVVGDAMTKFKQSRKPAPAPTPPADPASARRSRIAANVTPRGVGGHAAPNPNDDFVSGFNE